MLACPTPKENKGGPDFDATCTYTLCVSTWNECTSTITINPKCARHNHPSTQHPRELTNKWQHTDTVWYSNSAYIGIQYYCIQYTWSGSGYVNMGVVTVWCGCGSRITGSTGCKVRMGILVPSLWLWTKGSRKRRDTCSWIGRLWRV